MKQDRSNSRHSRIRALKGAQRAGAKSAISPLRAILPILLLAILGLGLVLSSNKVPQASASLQSKGGAPISEEAARQIQALIDEKESRTPAQKKMDSQLVYALKASRNQPIAVGVASLEIGAKIDGQNNTVVDIRLSHTTDLKTVYMYLQKNGDEVINAVYNNIRARVNLNRIEALAALPEVRFIMPRQEAMTSGQGAFGGQMSPLANLPVTSGVSAGFADRAARVRAQLMNALQPLGNYRKTAQQLGKVGPAQTNVVNTSEGDKTHKADLGRSSFGVSGTGVKVGVLSDGVSSLAAVQATGDLPATVTVLPGQAGSGDEGTAMLEIVHDLAPNAQLFFATAFTSITSFAQNIRDLRTAGCDIIIDDVGYFVETPLQDGQAPAVVSPTNGGIVLQAVNDVTAAGAMYFSSAGNEGSLDKASSGVWEGDFVNGGTLALVPGGNLNDFDPGAGVAQSNALTVGTSAPVSLFWSDPLGASANDYDLFILNSTSTSVLASSTNIQNGNDDPIEQLGVTTPAGRRAVILQKTGAANRFLHLNTFRGALTFGTTGQTHGHNQGALAYSVAATPVTDAFCAGDVDGPFPNPYTSANKIECFSSDGPRRILLNADSTPITPGNVSSTGGVLRQKPDITAADGVACAAPGFNPFYGTSAAAPHAGAIAALLKSANPSLTPAQIRTALVSSAIDIEGAGVDRDSGAGIIMAFEALQAIGAAPMAVIVSAGATLVSESCAPANGAIDPGETVTVSLCVQNTGASNTTALMGTLQATGGVTAIQPPNPQNYGVVVAGGPAVCRNFTFTASGACGGTITATVHFVDGATDLGNVTYTFSLGALGTPITISYTGPAVTIPDNSAAGVNIPLTVAGVGSVGDLNFRIDGSSCNTNNPSLTVGVDHSWVGDLKFTLTSPGGTASVVMMNRPGGGTFGASGNNFCQTLLDDDGAFPSIQSIASTGAPPLGPPYTGTFTPSSPLSGFDGKLADGIWMLNVSDNAAGDTGFVRAFSLIITPLVCSTNCATPCVITCPANITKSNDPNQCGAVVTYPAPTTTGSCGTVTCTPPSGSFFPVGTTTVTCQATDNSGTNATTPKAPKGAPGCTTITQSSSQAIVDNNSVSCNNGIGHTDNSYWRAFSLPSFGINGNFDVQSVDIGVELASAGVAGNQAAAPSVSKQKKIGTHAPNGGGSQPITINLYTSSSPFPTGFPASLTLIGTTSTTVADQADTVINIPVTGSAPAGSQLVVEVFTPDGEAAGNLFFIGSNTAAETGPSYLSAAACGITTPTTTAALGFPDMHIVMNVNGCEQVQGNGPTCTFTVTVNDTQPPVITCPANITAATPTVNSPCTVVNFTTTASDNCPGVTVVCNPPSGSCFPVGVTTVTCTATDAHSNTATCSFTISVFNGRLEDDSEGCNNTVLFNTLTGDYRWCCHGTTFTGRGKITRSGDTITLNHVAADRRVLINLAAGASTPTGNASLQFPVGTIRCVISDRDIRNDICLCGNAPPPSSKK